MNLKVLYFDNQIKFYDDYINAIEIENKKYFFRFVNDLYTLPEEVNDNILFHENEKEINLKNKVKVILNYFDLNFNSKKILTEVLKYVSNTISQEDKSLLQKEYTKIIKIFKKIINDIDLPFLIDDEVSIETLAKTLKLSVNTSEELLNNLFTLIDIEHTLNLNNLLVFINLKQYLKKEEIEELYKYAIYNKVQLLLVDSQSYGVTLKFEKKLIIDENLDEFVLQ